MSKLDSVPPGGRSHIQPAAIQRDRSAMILTVASAIGSSKESCSHLRPGACPTVARHRHQQGMRCICQHEPQTGGRVLHRLRRGGRSHGVHSSGFSVRGGGSILGLLCRETGILSGWHWRCRPECLPCRPELHGRRTKLPLGGAYGQTHRRAKFTRTPTGSCECASRFVLMAKAILSSTEHFHATYLQRAGCCLQGH